MFYGNTLNLKNISYIRKKYATFRNGINVDYDENLLPVNYSTNTYNFDYSNGALKDGLGINVPQIHYSYSNFDLSKTIDIGTKSVIGSYLFNWWDDFTGYHYSFLILYCGNGKVYYNDMHMSSTTINEISGVTFTEKPNFCSYKLNGYDTLIMTNEVDGMYTWVPNQSAQKITNAPKITSMCVHNERMFVTTSGEKRSVWFSENLDPTNFNLTLQEGGFVEIVDDYGKSNKVVSFGGYLYVFRDFNIARIASYAEQEKFTITQLYGGNSRIYENTVAICGDKIYYLANDGIYIFNGSSSTKIKLHINKLFQDINNYYAVGCYLNGYYYLSCKVDFGDDISVGCENNQGYHNNAIIRINVETGELCILRGYDIRNMSVINDLYDPWVMTSVYNQNNKYLFGRLDMSGKVMNVNTYKVWESPQSDFGYPERDKLVREIILKSKSNCIVEIKCDNNVRNYNVTGANKYQSIKPYLKGRRIAINFKSDQSNCDISNPQVVVGVL